MTISQRTRAYTEYNEAESAWGYFDSQDLADDDEDEEDELYEDDHGASGSRHRMQDPRGNSMISHSNGHLQDRGAPPCYHQFSGVLLTSPLRFADAYARRQPNEDALGYPSSHTPVLSLMLMLGE